MKVWQTIWYVACSQNDIVYMATFKDNLKSQRTESGMDKIRGIMREDLFVPIGTEQITHSVTNIIEI